jgi:putative transposase
VATVFRDLSGKHDAFALVQTGNEVEPAQLSDEAATVGTNLGLKHFAALSRGEKINAPRFVRGFSEEVGTRAQSLARSISDLTWTGFVRRLQYKAGWYGKIILPNG